MLVHFFTFILFFKADGKINGYFLSPGKRIMDVISGL